MEDITITITLSVEELKKLGFDKMPTKEDVCEAIHDAIYLADARV